MNILENIKNTQVPTMDWTTGKNISYTQLSAWSECPHRWKLMYIDKMKQPPSHVLSSQLKFSLISLLDIVKNTSKNTDGNY